MIFFLMFSSEAHRYLPGKTFDRRTPIGISVLFVHVFKSYKAFITRLYSLCVNNKPDTKPLTQSSVLTK